MRYVLDSSVAFKWLVPEADTPKALRLLDDFNNGVHDLVAPDILPVETVHALTRAERQGRITPAEGIVLIKDLFQNLPPLPLTCPCCLEPMKSRLPCALGCTIAFTWHWQSVRIASWLPPMTSSSKTFRVRFLLLLHWPRCRNPLLLGCGTLTLQTATKHSSPSALYPPFNR